MQQPNFSSDKIPAEGSIILIGMASSGKTTLGQILADRLGWAGIDTDHLIESWYGAELQQVVDTLGKNKFLKAEEDIVASLSVKRCIISTGGSVVYGPKAMERLHSLGPVIWLYAPPEVIEARIALAPDRGLAIGPGQTIADLINERIPLYEAAADLKIDTSACSPEECVEQIIEWLAS